MMFAYASICTVIFWILILCAVRSTENANKAILSYKFGWGFLWIFLILIVGIPALAYFMASGVFLLLHIMQSLKATAVIAPFALLIADALIIFAADNAVRRITK